MPLGTFITTATVSLGATESSTITHGLSAAPDFVWATQKHTTANVTSSNTLQFCAGGMASTASITVYNRGLGVGTFTVCIARFHSVVR